MSARTPVWMNGLGTQSTAVAVLIAQGKLPAPKMSISADTSRERSESFDYARKYTFPLLETLGVDVVIAGHDLATVDLYAKNGDLLIPAFMAGGTGKLPTFCSIEWKRRVCLRKMREPGYGPDNPVEMWFGMSREEVLRMKTSDVQWASHRYPLAMELRLSKDDCRHIVERYGWPAAPGSHCWMCPHMPNPEWREIKRTPDQWQAAILVDRQVTESHGVYLHHSGVPLEQANLDDDPPPQPGLWDNCNSGLCEIGG